MLRIVFILIIFLHGLIHMMGFAKAFGYSDIAALAKSIPKPVGIAWFTTCIFFVVTGIGFILKKEWWPWVAFLAVILSQAVIISNWRDARFGSLANIIILIAAIIGYADIRFKKQCSQEIQILLSGAKGNTTTVTPELTRQLPAPVQRWLLRSGVINREPAHIVRLQQTGEMRLKPGGRWTSFTASQYFTTGSPGFVWTTRVQLFPLIYLSGRDKLVNGNAGMQMKLLSVADIVNDSNNEKINSGAMIRYLAEMCWFPSAAVQPWLTWETIDSASAKATMNVSGKQVTGVFHFSTEGDLLQFTAERYRGSDDKAMLENWIVECLEYREFNGIRIPYRCDVTWQEPSGDFTWLSVKITDIDYNERALYKHDY